MSHFDELIKLKTYIKLYYIEDGLEDISNNCNNYIQTMIQSKITEKKELVDLKKYLENELEKIKNDYLKNELMNEYENILKKIKLSDKELYNYKNILNI